MGTDLDVDLLLDPSLDGVEDPNSDINQLIRMGDYRAAKWFDIGGDFVPPDPERDTVPACVRLDKGPELTSAALRDCCLFNGAGPALIEPGAPWHNGYVESFNGKIRDELLSGELLSGEVFATLTEARILIEVWPIEYNWNRPHSALGNMTPAAFAANLITNQDHQ